LKLATLSGEAVSLPFPLWQHPEELTQTLVDLLRRAPSLAPLAVTMTGELADCFKDKADGVEQILSALTSATPGRVVRVYLVDGRLVTTEQASQVPLLTAASNWHAVTRLAAKYAPQGQGLFLDIGSTTTDIIPLFRGEPVARGATDPERLLYGELVYTGVKRTAVCGVVSHLPWRGEPCPVAAELFATTRDAYLTLGLLAEKPNCTQTADGRPATHAAARSRLARMICADDTLFSQQDAQAAGSWIQESQIRQIVTGARQVIARQEVPPTTLVTSGEGEFLARKVAQVVAPDAEFVSLSEKLGDVVSRCAPAYAVAMLASEQGIEG